MRASAEVADFRQRTETPKRLSDLFHVVNRVIPEGQAVRWVSPETPAREALAIMKELGFSQLPVKEGAAVLGLFTYRAFALEAAQIGDSKIDIASLPVEEFLEHERPAYARLSDEFSALIEELDMKDCVVVSGPEDLIAILTPMDVLRYLNSVANAYVLIEEIEVSLRVLIRAATPDLELFKSCIDNALASKYKEGEIPSRLEEMTFDDYIALLRDGRNWAHFETVFGGTRDRTRGKLEPIRKLRNDVFHFRGEISVGDHERLATCRSWLMRCIRKMDARQGGDR